MQPIKDLFSSKKFIALVFGLCAIVASGLLGIGVEALISEAGVISAYLASQGISDAGKEKAKLENMANSLNRINQDAEYTDFDQP